DRNLPGTARPRPPRRRPRPPASFSPWIRANSRPSPAPAPATPTRRASSPWSPTATAFTGRRVPAVRAFWRGTVNFLADSGRVADSGVLLPSPPRGGGATRPAPTASIYSRTPSWRRCRFLLDISEKGDPGRGRGGRGRGGEPGDGGSAGRQRRRQPAHGHRRLHPAAPGR